MAFVSVLIQSITSHEQLSLRHFDEGKLPLYTLGLR
jgi:hypothetical protein